MLYLKNTLGGLSRSLTDSALHSFQGPHRWWKLALFAVLFVLPGGSVAVAILAWVEHRRGRKGSKSASVELAAGPVQLRGAAALRDQHGRKSQNSCAVSHPDHISTDSAGGASRFVLLRQL
ncbi:hypothetical protein LMG28727_05308 [Paraburkholderia kirstenboschensis]|uniref:hypothetical protein n=1 Tax=Paraburkholderia kirstenboschensis TaxID=1245436 RepID=UPI001A0A7A2B|nr:hypothetical protein [Paraburkholderia kirstenboschensis]CAD6551895.1 hypothetical protein LMG28727_05308 [Paraburkholderia kirstenboschensis]